MKNYKYMAIPAEAEYILVGNNKSKLMKETLSFARISFDSYLENCKVLDEEPELELKSFKFDDSIENYDKQFVEKYLKGFDIYEI